jgi:hypothetical protein
MGLFDNVHCRYRLPDPEAQELNFQTKSMPAPYLEAYEITEHGRLLHQAYDARWEKDPDSPVPSVMHRDNCRWEPVDFRGQLEIYATGDGRDGNPRWYSCLSWFKDGRVADLQHGQRHGQPL